MNSYSEKKDDVLVELTLLGNEEAFCELVVRHEKAVKGTAFKVTGNVYSAEDASQDAFVSAWINLDSLRKRESFKSWVCSIANNCAKDIVVHYRSAVPDISLDLQSYEEIGFRDFELGESIANLSEKIRETVELHYFKGLSISEIAKILDISEGTVKWRLHEGRKQLRKEHGVMEKDYDENRTLVQKVMYQVEKLKLWSLKNDKSGFEEEYKVVLKAVESLEESKEKDHALADVLLRGYWWIYKESNDELFMRIKESAVKSENEDVLMTVCEKDFYKYGEGEARINYIKDTQIPYYSGLGLKKVCGYLWFWLGQQYCRINEIEKGIECYKKVLTLLSKGDVYYSCALSAISVEKMRKSHGLSYNDNRCSTTVSADVFRLVDGKYYFWLQPAYYSGSISKWIDNLFWYCTKCDSMIYDLEMRPGDKYISSDKTAEFIYECDNISVSTPAGDFENCAVFTVKSEKWGIRYIRTVFAPGVGIVEQRINIWGDETVWQLSECNIAGGEGYFPLFEGNKWVYANITDDRGKNLEHINSYELIFADEDKVIMSHIGFCRMVSYKDTWYGNSIAYRENYCWEHNTDNYKLNDISGYLKRAEELCETKRQKVHTAVARDVMTRIFDTDPNYTPDCKEVGLWNFFRSNTVKKKEKDIIIEFNCDYDFEWKNAVNLGTEGLKILNTFLISDLYDFMGKVWSDEWIPGYVYEKEVKLFGNDDNKTDLRIEVTGDENVVTPAGEFANCRHVHFRVKDLKDGLSYMNGNYDYWFAPNVGIVRVKQENCDWVLTKYKGRGEGYFPIADSLYRKYEPTELGDGYHAWCEYTFDEDEDGIVIFGNHLGTQDRADFERAMNTPKA